MAYLLKENSIMLLLNILALFIHTAYSITPCHYGVEIVSKETDNPQDLIGNWTYVYHWDNMNKFDRDLIYNRAAYMKPCPTISIKPTTPEEVKAKEAECVDYDIPFNWADAKLKLDAPHRMMKGSILVIGGIENWMMFECNVIARVELKKVPGDYIVMVYPEMANISEMMARRVPTMKELKCVAHNVDVGKYVRDGFELCSNMI